MYSKVFVVALIKDVWVMRSRFCTAFGNFFPCGQPVSTCWDSWNWRCSDSSLRPSIGPDNQKTMQDLSGSMWLRLKVQTFCPVKVMLKPQHPFRICCLFWASEHMCPRSCGPGKITDVHSSQLISWINICRGFIIVDTTRMLMWQLHTHTHREDAHPQNTSVLKV